jgi:hypothetical protein
VSLRNVLSAAFSGLGFLGRDAFSVTNLIRRGGRFIVTILDQPPMFAKASAHEENAVLHAQFLSHQSISSRFP